MSDNTHSDVKELKEILVGFISEQKIFNENLDKKFKNINDFIIEQRVFNNSMGYKFINIDKSFSEQRVFNKTFDKKFVEFVAEQRALNENIEQKIDKVQYFLEETIAEHTKMFFEEQNELKDEVIHLKNDMIHGTSQINMLLAR